VLHMNKRDKMNKLFLLLMVVGNIASNTITKAVLGDSKYTFYISMAIWLVFCIITSFVIKRVYGKVTDEERKESQLALTDERGKNINFRAGNSAWIVTIIALLAATFIIIYNIDNEALIKNLLGGILLFSYAVKELFIIYYRKRM
jgi:p-aminobenzoyl-glutamate transporter AbgT